MKQVFKIDFEGFYLEPVLIEENDEIPVDCVKIRPPNGLFKAKFINDSWGEGLTQAEIDSIKNTPVPLSEMEEVKKQVTDLAFELMIKGLL